MRRFITILISLALLSSLPAHAMNAKYRQQLEKSGCTQVSELQGCDIHKSKSENAKAGYVNDEVTPATKGHSCYMEHSGCTQASELQGCDIHKSKTENANTGFGSSTQNQNAAHSGSPYAGQWTAKSDSGDTVATIQISAQNQVQVQVNGKKVKAKMSDGALVFHDGMITFTIQGDRRLRAEDVWFDSDAGSRGVITEK